MAMHAKCMQHACCEAFKVHACAVCSCNSSRVKYGPAGCGGPSARLGGADLGAASRSSCRNLHERSARRHSEPHCSAQPVDADGCQVCVERKGRYHPPVWVSSPRLPLSIAPSPPALRPVARLVEQSSRSHPGDCLLSARRRPSCVICDFRCDRNGCLPARCCVLRTEKELGRLAWLLKRKATMQKGKAGPKGFRNCLSLPRSLGSCCWLQRALQTFAAFTSQKTTSIKSLTPAAVPATGEPAWSTPDNSH